AAGAGAVLDDELLAEMIGKPLAHDPRRGIDRAPRRETVDEVHRPVRIIAGDGRRHPTPQQADEAEQAYAQASFHASPNILSWCRACFHKTGDLPTSSVGPKSDILTRRIRA